MRKDFKRYSIYLNRFYLSNWSIGIDYYQIHEYDTFIHQASVFQVSLLFFNVTITRWQDPQWT